MIKAIIITGLIIMFIPLIIWFLRSVAVVHRNWKPPRWYGNLLRWSWLFMPIGLIIIFLSYFAG